MVGKEPEDERDKVQCPGEGLPPTGGGAPPCRRRRMKEVAHGLGAMQRDLGSHNVREQVNWELVK